VISIKVGVIINGAEALQAWRDGTGDRAAWPREIPEGCNTAWDRFTDAEGRPALVIRQSGFKRGRGEAEVNGISVLVALDAQGEAAYQSLETIVSQMLREDDRNG
jgi:hypothetical protein